MLIALGSFSKEHARQFSFHEDVKSEGTCRTKAAFIFQPAHAIRKNEDSLQVEGVIKVQLKLAALLPTPRSS